jgi:hypothetical protein
MHHQASSCIVPSLLQPSAHVMHCSRPSTTHSVIMHRHASFIPFHSPVPTSCIVPTLLQPSTHVMHRSRPSTARSVIMHCHASFPPFYSLAPASCIVPTPSAIHHSHPSTACSVIMHHHASMPPSYNPTLTLCIIPALALPGTSIISHPHSLVPVSCIALPSYSLSHRSAPPTA